MLPVLWQAVHCCLSGLEMSHGTPELSDRDSRVVAGCPLLSVGYGDVPRHAGAV